MVTQRVRLAGIVSEALLTVSWSGLWRLGCMLSLHPVADTAFTGTGRPGPLTIEPDFVLMRNQPRGPVPANDRRNVLFGLMMANIPCVNSAYSEYCNLERPIMYGALREIRDRVGKDKFPLHDINYYSSSTQMVVCYQSTAKTLAFYCN